MAGTAPHRATRSWTIRRPLFDGVGGGLAWQRRRHELARRRPALGRALLGHVPRSLGAASPPHHQRKSNGSALPRKQHPQVVGNTCRHQLPSPPQFWGDERRASRSDLPLLLGRRSVQEVHGGHRPARRTVARAEDRDLSRGSAPHEVNGLRLDQHPGLLVVALVHNDLALEPRVSFLRHFSSSLRK